MRVETINCPYCGASLEVDIQDRESVFCNYCGKQILLYDDSVKTKNVNVKKEINIQKRIVNDAEVIRARAEEKENKNAMVVLAIVFGVLLLISALGIGIPSLINATNKSAGNLNAGYYKDLIGEDYKSVQAHFESAGFTNIELIDLNDSGLAFWKDGEVEIISVGGNTTFESLDWFAPDTKVVISYH